MKKIETFHLEPGMVVAKPVLEGALVLVDIGVELDLRTIQILQRRNGIDTVYIEDNELTLEPDMVNTLPVELIFERNLVRNIGIDSYDALSEYTPMVDYDRECLLPKAMAYVESNLKLYPLTEFYNELASETTKIFSEFRNLSGVFEHDIEIIVSAILEKSRKHPRELFDLLTNYTPANYIVSHSINVTMLSLILGIRAGFDEETLMLLGMGALLHDIGMLLIDQPIWNEKRKLNEDEMFEIKKHTVYGIDTILDKTNLPKEVGYVAYLHHERMDGSGYPRGKKYNIIDKLTQLVSVCDVFEAIISPRPYRKYHSATNALFSLKYECKNMFNPYYIELLIDYIKEEIDDNIISDLEMMKKQRLSGKSILLICDKEKDFSPILINSLMKYGLNVDLKYSDSDNISLSDQDIVLLSSNSPDLLLRKIKDGTEDYYSIPILIFDTKEKFRQKNIYVLENPLFVDALNSVIRILSKSF